MSKSPKAEDLPLPPVPDEKFSIISLDPAWHHETRAPLKDDAAMRTPQKHYPTMSLEHIASIPVRQMAKPDAWVFLWMTGPLMVRGVHNKLFEAWNVKPSSLAFVWIKLWNNTDVAQFGRTPLLEQDLALGMGLTTRQNAEFVMLGKIGSPRVGRHDIRQVIVSPRREHSRKPEEYYRRVEHFAVGNRLDCFAGAERTGWTSWGWSHRSEERVDQAVQRTGRRALCHTCEKPAPVNDVGVCAPCMEAAAL